MYVNTAHYHRFNRLTDSTEFALSQMKAGIIWLFTNELEIEIETEMSTL